MTSELGIKVQEQLVRQLTRVAGTRKLRRDQLPSGISIALALIQTDEIQRNFITSMGIEA